MQDEQSPQQKQSQLRSSLLSSDARYKRILKHSENLKFNLETAKLEYDQVMRDLRECADDKQSALSTLSEFLTEQHNKHKAQQKG